MTGLLFLIEMQRLASGHVKIYTNRKHIENNRKLESNKKKAIKTRKYYVVIGIIF